MATWTHEQLSRLDAAQEIRITPLADDGSEWTGRLIWVVVVGERVVVRSWKGPGIAWYTRALESGRARIAIEQGGSDFSAEVVVRRASDASLDGKADAAYLDKYPEPYASEMVAPRAAQTTIELLPA